MGCKWATNHDSTVFGQEVRPYFLPGSTLVTLIVFSLSVPKKQEVHLYSLESTGGYGYVCHSGLSFALQPLQSMSGNKMDDLRWSSPANSKQISLSIEAPLNSGTSCMVWDANGPQITTVLFSDKRCVHTSCQDRLL